MTRIFLASGESIESALAHIPETEGSASSRSVILPSSLDRSDRLARHAREHSQGGGEIVVPAVLGGLLRGRHWWSRVATDYPGVELADVRLPSDVVKTRRRVIVCDLDRVAETGPFVLDVLARYLHPTERLRLLASGTRAAACAEINLGMMPIRSIVTITCQGRIVVAWTDDPVAGELVALALSELRIGGRVSFTGPWEDAVVQRATEIELGVTFPHQIEIESVVADAATDLIFRHLRDRLGLLNPQG